MDISNLTSIGLLKFCRKFSFIVVFYIFRFVTDACIYYKKKISGLNFRRQLSILEHLFQKTSERLLLMTHIASVQNQPRISRREGLNEVLEHIINRAKCYDYRTFRVTMFFEQGAYTYRHDILLSQITISQFHFNISYYHFILHLQTRKISSDVLRIQQIIQIQFVVPCS